ncbi:sulfotransferase family 2 domain-containing protein [Alteromonas sp. CYL-A6]|uniref:sulfotransferase family 2 domain-containing protein n=1 Tax=Alteromonas nitratireducens TaxID=3390813 RepID=UPI0034B06E86
MSYHIPKTAGTSLRSALEAAYGWDAVFGCYRSTGAKALSAGKSVWLPRGTKVVHGHVRTHQNHHEIFPNAKRIVWVRDPVERAWSMLTRLLARQDSHEPVYSVLKSRYIDKGISDKAELFECYLKDKQISRFAFAYKLYFSAIPISDFDFVGSVHSMEDDMRRLSDVLNIELSMHTRNRRTAGKDMPDAVWSLKPLFEDEYKIVAPYLRKD